jgi:hypothetical protein
MSSTHLSVDVTRWRVSPTPRTVDFSNSSSTFITAIITGWWVLCCICTCFYFSIFSFVSMYFMLFCLGFVGFSLPLYLGFNFVVETNASGESTSFSSASDSDLTNAFPILTSFGWLMLFYARGANGFGPHGVLTPIIRVYKPLKVYDSSNTPSVFKTILCGPLERTELIIWLISYFVSVTYTVNFFCLGPL